MGETLPYRDTGDKTVDKFGWSVSLSSDGKRLAVGAPNSSGRVFVYSYDYDWKDISGDLTVRVAGEPATESDSVEYSLALSDDGRYRWLIHCHRSTWYARNRLCFDLYVSGGAN